MQILYSRCCGIDVHKDSVTVFVLVYSGSPEPDVRKREFATHLKALLNLKMWLLAQKVTHVAMESTGVYWKPVRQALEGKLPFDTGQSVSDQKHSRQEDRRARQPVDCRTAGSWFDPAQLRPAPGYA